MSEKKAVAKTTDKKAVAKKTEGKKKFNIVKTFKDMWAEIKKVTWPSKQGTGSSVHRRYHVCAASDRYRWTYGLGSVRTAEAHHFLTLCMGHGKNPHGGARFGL